MYRKGTILLPVLIVLIIISLALAGGLFYLYQKEHAQNIILQDKIVELGNRQRITESQLEDSKKSAAEFQLKLQESKAREEALNSELTQEKSARLEISNKLEQIKTDLEQQKSLRKDIESRLNQAQDDGKKIKEQIRIIQQQKTELEEKIKNMEVGLSGVELGKVVVNSETAVVAPEANDAISVAPKTGKEEINPPAPATKPVKANKKEQLPALKSLEGKVMVINKEFNFVVINLGSKDNVNLGDEFLVWRNGNPIGNLKVEKVHETMSAAGFAAELKDLIKENDKVTQKAK
jgi:chromosome segregation ATPase